MVTRRAGYFGLTREGGERIIELGRVVIPSDNTPPKAVGDLLIPSPVWRYKGPAKSITITYQVGRWSAVGFAGDSPIATETFTQKSSDDWANFEPETALKGVKLTGLKPATGDLYDMEMWFKAPGMADQGVIFTRCCEVPSAAPEIEIVSCSFS